MMTLLQNFPENVIAVAGKGKVSAEDYQKVLIPAVEKALQSHKKVRFLYDLGAEFSGMELGAMWQDFSFGVGHFNQWERVAVVTDNEWIKHAVHAFSFMMPCPIQVFSNAEFGAARTWILS